MHRQGDRGLIDPRATIDSTAQLDEGVKVGPFTVIGPDVTIGKGTTLESHVVIKGPTHIGEDNHIFQFASVGEDPQDKKYAGEATHLEIGDRNVIREYATINRGTVQGGGETRIGNDNLLMAYIHIAHDCLLSNHIIMANGASMGGHVSIHDHAILGGFAMVHQFCRVGAHSFAGVGAFFSKDLPPYVMAAGHPAKPYGINSEGLRRRGFDEDSILRIKRAYKLIYQSKKRLTEAVDELREMARQAPELEILVDFIASSERSILR